MEFLKKSGWSFMAVMVRALGALGINKFFAYHFGTSGITLLAHFQNLISLFTQIPNDGVNRSIIKNLSDPRKEKGFKQDILSSGVLLTSMVFTVVMIFVFINNEKFIEPFIDYISEGVFLIIVIFSMIAILGNLFLQSIILADSRIKAYSILTMAGVGVVLLFLAVAVNYRLLEVAFIAYALGNSVSLIFSLFYINQGMHFKISLTEPTRESMLEIIHFIGMALSVLVFGKLIDFYIRAASIDWFGMEDTGYWQSLVKLSDSYVMVFIGTIGTVFFPKVSSLVNDRKEMINYLIQVLTVVVPAVGVGLIIIFMLGEPILSILYTGDFVAAYEYMHLQFTGDFFMLISWLFAYIIMAKKKTWIYIAMQALSAFVYLVIIFLFKADLGIESILIGHIGRNVVFFAILLILVIKIK